MIERRPCRTFARASRVPDASRGVGHQPPRLLSAPGRLVLGVAAVPRRTNAQEMPLVGDTQLDFMMDGGIRNGTDILIALSYGLKAVGIGRVTAAGIGAGGPKGLRRAFEILHEDLDRAMRLVGVQSVEEIRNRGEEIRRDSMLHGDDHLPKFVF